MKIVVKLKEALEKRNMTQKELAQLAEIRESSISELSRGVRTGVNKDHLSKIATVLGITDIRDLIDFENGGDQS